MRTLAANNGWNLNQFDQVVLSYPGEHREGRDGLHMMGSDDGRQVHTNVYMKHQMGFFDSAYLGDVTENSVHRLYAYDVDALSVKNQPQ